MLAKDARLSGTMIDDDHLEVQYINERNLNTTFRVIVDHALVVIPENILGLARRWLWGEKNTEWDQQKGEVEADLWHRWGQSGSQRPHGTPPRPVRDFYTFHLKYSDMTSLQSKICKRVWENFQSDLNIRLRIDDVQLDPSRDGAQWGGYLVFPFISLP